MLACVCVLVTGRENAKEYTWGRLQDLKWTSSDTGNNRREIANGTHGGCVSLGSIRVAWGTGNVVGGKGMPHASDIVIIARHASLSIVFSITRQTALSESSLCVLQI